MPEARMKPLSLRRLTPAERALGAEMFGAGLNAEKVRILALPAWGRAFVAGSRLMCWPAPHARTDFGAADVPLPLQAVFVHELTHVWQAQHGVFLLLAKLKAGDRLSAYAYDLEAGPPFTALNIEQQAMVVEHAFLASRGIRVQHAPETYANLGDPWRQA